MDGMLVFFSILLGMEFVLIVWVQFFFIEDEGDRTAMLVFQFMVVLVSIIFGGLFHEQFSVRHQIDPTPVCGTAEPTVSEGD